MIIECMIKRKAGSTSTLDGVDYHFRPYTDKEDAPHIAAVNDPKHIQHFLSIEGYQMFAKGDAITHEIAQSKVAAFGIEEAVVETTSIDETGDDLPENIPTQDEIDESNQPDGPDATQGDDQPESTDDIEDMDAILDEEEYDGDAGSNTDAEKPA